LGKTIKVEDEVYQRLERLIVHRETFSHVIERLLKLYDMMSDVSTALGPSHYLNQRPNKEVK